VRSAFLSRSDIAVKKEAGSLFMSGRLRRKWLRIQEIDFAGIVAVSAGNEFLQPRPKNASEAIQEKFRSRLYILAVPTTSRH
jgi:hypothetical protein